MRNRSFVQAVPGWEAKTEGDLKAMKNQGRYRHLRVDWVGESSTQSITLCGGANEDSAEPNRHSAPTAPRSAMP